MRRSTVASALLLVALASLTSCQALNAATSVVGGGIACSRSEVNRAFPEQGEVREIVTRFILRDNDRLIEFHDVARCEYQGSICGGGYWHDVWYAQDQDRDAMHEWTLGDGNRMVYRPHSMCIFLSNYTDACAERECNPVDYFPIVAVFSERYAILNQERIREAEAARSPGVTITYPSGYIVDRLVLTFRTIGEWGFEIEPASVEVSGPVDASAETLSHDE